MDHLMLRWTKVLLQSLSCIKPFLRGPVFFKKKTLQEKQYSQQSSTQPVGKKKKVK